MKNKILCSFGFAILLVLSAPNSPAMAQQADTPPPSAPSGSQAGSAPEQKPEQKPDPTPQKPDPTAQKPDATPALDPAIGKSKLEQETGTVNDRLLGVMPNYGTVETSKELQALTPGEKFRIATASVFDWTALPFNTVLAGIAQAKNDPSSWGQGWGAYGKRFGETFADNSIGTYMTTAIFPSLLHEDPRYYQLGRGSFGHRAFYAMNRLFVTRKDSGAMGFNYSESIGNAAAAAISNIYHPEQDRNASRNASTFGFLILYDGLANEMKEFWPDVRRKVFHKKDP